MKGKHAYAIKVTFTSDKLLTERELSAFAERVQVRIVEIEKLGIKSWEVQHWAMPAEETVRKIEAKVRKWGGATRENEEAQREEGERMQQFSEQAIHDAEVMLKVGEAVKV